MKFAHERDAQGKPTEMLRLEIADISGKRQVLALSARPLLSVKLAHNAILAAYEYNVPQALLTDLHNQFQQAEQEGRDDLYTALKTLDEPIPRTISDRLFDTLSELATNPNKGKSAGMGFV